MSELDRLWCTIRDTQERVTELEKRASILEDGEEFSEVTLEDWPDDAEDDFGDDFEARFSSWDDEDEEAYQARQGVTGESDT